MTRSHRLPKEDPHKQRPSREIEQSTSHKLRKALISLQAAADKDVFGWNYQI
jgi:hypothetical protein